MRLKFTWLLKFVMLLGAAHAFSASLFQASAAKSGTHYTPLPFDQLRNRLVVIDVAALKAAAGGGASHSTAPITLNFFADLTFSAKLDQTDWLGPDRFVSFFKVNGGTDLAVISCFGGYVSGWLTTPQGTYTIRYAGDNQHWIYKCPIKRQSADTIDAPTAPHAVDTLQATSKSARGR